MKAFYKLIRLVQRLKYYLLVFVLLELASGGLLHNDFTKKKARYFSKELAQLTISYQAILNTYGHAAQMLYDEILAAPEVLDMLNYAQTVATDRQGDLRNLLYQHIRPRYQQIAGQNVSILTFYLPDGTVFLRTQNPQLFGDNESESRHSLTIVNTQQRAVSGFEVGEYDIGFRYLFPIFSGQKYLGSLEVGIALDGIRYEMEQLFMREFLFVFHSDVLGQQAETHDYAQSKLHGEYVRDAWNVFVHEGKTTIETIDARISHSVAWKLDQNQPFAISTQVDEGSDFLITFTPITDIQRQPVAYLVSYSRDNTVRGYIVANSITMAGTTLVVVLFVLSVYSINYHRSRIARDERRFKQITHSLSEGLCVLDHACRITFVNPAVERILNYSPHELTGTYLYDITRYQTETGEMFYGKNCPIYRAMDKRVAYTSDNHLLITKENIPTPVDITSAPIWNDGSIEGTVVVFRDITARKQAEEQLQQMNQQLQEASQHKSDFLSRMSHELRTPLNAMIGYTALTLNGLRDSIAPEYLQNLIKAEQSARILLELINDVLDFSKIEAGRMEIFFEELDLHEILEDIVVTAEGLNMNTQVELRTAIHADLPPVCSDYTKIKQILNNLVSNAIKFTTEGFVEIRAVPMPDEHIIRIEVEDTGCGIPDEKLDMIFESFKQIDGSIKKKFGGTGLGLAITKKLCEMLDIDINVQSEVDRGTTFWLGIPAQFDAAVYAEAPRPGIAPLTANVEPDFQAEQLAGTSDKYSLLVVDDNEVNCELIVKIFEAEGHTIYTAGSGLEGVRVAQTYQPDVVLMDLAMPDMDGFEATQLLKEFPVTSDITVIAYSALVTKECREKAYQVGCEGYIIKPVEPKHLIEQVTKFVIASKMKNEI